MTDPLVIVCRWTCFGCGATHEQTEHMNIGPFTQPFTPVVPRGWHVYDGLASCPKCPLCWGTPAADPVAPADEPDPPPGLML